MKVTIDTKEDSHEDIYKVLQILTNILERKGPGEHIQRGFQEEERPVDGASMMSMFDSPPVLREEKTVTEGTPPDFSSFLSLTRKEENKEPRIEFY